MMLCTMESNTTLQIFFIPSKQYFPNCKGLSKLTLQGIWLYFTICNIYSNQALQFYRKLLLLPSRLLLTKDVSGECIMMLQRKKTQFSPWSLLTILHSARIWRRRQNLNCDGQVFGMNVRRDESSYLHGNFLPFAFSMATFSSKVTTLDAVKKGKRILLEIFACFSKYIFVSALIHFMSLCFIN